MNLIKRNNQLLDPLDFFSDRWLEAFDPQIDVREESDRYVLQADLPGLSKDDFEISVEGSHLTLRGKRSHEKETKAQGYYYSERSYGTFSRTLEFPAELQAEKVKAAYKNGVLEVTLPKSENAKSKQIDVQVN